MQVIRGGSGPSQFLWAMYRDAVLHEAEEHFMVDGQRVFDPHQGVRSEDV